MSQQIIGVDIGSYSIKVAIIERSFKAFSFVGFYERDIQYSDVLSDIESKTIALQGLIDDHDIQWDIACVGFPSELMTARLLSFPFASRKKLDLAIPFEVESFIPFNIDEMLIDYTVVSQSKQLARVLALYVNKGDIAKKLSLLESVDIDPRYLSVEGLELLHLVNMGMVPPEGVYAIIDMGHSKSTIVICHAEELGYARAISIAGKSITEAIAKRLNVPIEEAENLKIEMGQLPPDEDVDQLDEISKEIVVAIKQVMTDFFLHLKQTFFTYRDQDDTPVSGIYLCGGSSRIPGIDRHISEIMNQNVSYLNCADFQFTNLSRADAHRHIIPMALSHAMKGIAGGETDINLRKGEFAFTGNVEEIGGKLKRIALIIAWIVFLALTSFTVEYYAVNQQVDKYQQDIKALIKQNLPNIKKNELKKITNAKSALKRIRGRKSTIDIKLSELKQIQGVSPVDVLNEFSKILPTREMLVVDVDTFTVKTDTSKVIIKGIVPSHEAGDQLKPAIEKSSMFKSITSKAESAVKGVKFELTMLIIEDEKCRACKGCRVVNKDSLDNCDDSCSMCTEDYESF